MSGAIFCWCRCAHAIYVCMLRHMQAQLSVRSVAAPILNSLSWVVVSKKSEKGNGQLRVAKAWINSYRQKKKPSGGIQAAHSESAGDTSLSSIASATQSPMLVDEEGVISPSRSDRLTVVTSSELPSSRSALLPPGPRSSTEHRSGDAADDCQQHNMYMIAG